MLQTFINHPVLSTVISIVIVIMGLVGLTSLPIQQFQDIAPPTVEVSASYPGANADVVLNSIIAPLEEKINGVEGKTYMVSSANNDGSATIQVFFSLATDPDMAAVNVLNRSDNPIHNETFIQNYARIYIVNVPQYEMVTLKTVYGSDLIKRYNMFPCTTINITPQEGYSTCQAMNAAAIAAQELPTGFTYEYSGMTRDELKSGGQQMFVFALSFMLVFFILAALMESGAGAAENISIGISAAGGFLISTILGLLFVPVSFVIFKGLQERISKK